MPACSRPLRRSLAFAPTRGRRSNLALRLELRVVIAIAPRPPTSRARLANTVDAGRVSAVLPICAVASRERAIVAASPAVGLMVVAVPPGTRSVVTPAGFTALGLRASPPLGPIAPVPGGVIVLILAATATAVPIVSVPPAAVGYLVAIAIAPPRPFTPTGTLAPRLPARAATPAVVVLPPAGSLIAPSPAAGRA